MANIIFWRVLFRTTGHINVMVVCQIKEHCPQRDRGRRAGGPARGACRGDQPAQSDRSVRRWRLTRLHLATKILLDDKTRFLTTVSGVGFSVMLVIVQVGIFLGMLENASIAIERLDADIWVTARNTPNIDFANTFPELYVHASDRCPV